MLHRLRRIQIGILATVLLTTGGIATAPAQPAPLTLRLALVSQWVVNQHRVAGPAQGRALSPEFRAALDGGVVDRSVFWWQRGLIQRRLGLVWKPVRVLAGPEAAALGGRGVFELLSVRPPLGTSAWTEVDLSVRTAQPDDVLVLELGGERQTMTQVLETLVVRVPDGAFREVRLTRRALIPGEGVQVVAAPFGLPLEPSRAALFQGIGGVEVLVARSQIPAITDGAVTANGPADTAAPSTGDWREGDRVFLRMPLTTLRAGGPALVLGWKDRTEKPEGGEGDGNRKPVSLRAPR